MNQQIHKFLKDVHCTGTKTHIGQGVDSVDLGLRKMELTTPDRLDKYLEERNYTNIFFATGIDPEYPAKRHGKAAVIKRKHFTIDFDVRNNAEDPISNQDIKEYANHFKQMLSQTVYLRDWAYIVFSGNGLHIHYIYHKELEITPYDIEAYEAVVEQFMIRAGEVCGEKPDTATKLLSQPVRLPGTINFKKDRKIQTEILFEQDNRLNVQKWYEWGEIQLKKKKKQALEKQEEYRQKSRIGVSRYNSHADDAPWDIVDNSVDLSDLIIKDKGWQKNSRQSNRGLVTGFSDEKNKSKGLFVFYPQDRKGGVLVSQSGSEHYPDLNGKGSFNFIKTVFCNGDTRETVAECKSLFPHLF